MSKGWETIKKERVQLMCALRTHVKLSIFRNIFLGIEKAVNTFSILKKISSKNENYFVPLGHTLAKSKKKI